MKKRNGLLFGGLFLLMVGTQVCGATWKDSGWVSLFNGKDLEGWYVRESGQLKDVKDQNTFSVIPSYSVIQANGSGYVATKKSYSNYQLRVEYRFRTPTDGARNSGVLYHILSSDTTKASSGTWPTCIEYQLYNGGGINSSSNWLVGPHAGAFLGIGGIWGQSKVDRNYFCAYKEDGEAYNIQPGGLECIGSGHTRRVGSVTKLEALDDRNEWVWAQLNSYGSDSSVHLVNDERVLKAWNLSIGSQGTPATGGHIGLQAEGANIWFRSILLRSLDDSGNPIIPGCTDSTASNYKNYATQDDESCLITSSISSSNFQSVLNSFEFMKSRTGWTIHYSLQNTQELVSLHVHSVSGKLLYQTKVQSGKNKVLSIPSKELKDYKGLFILKLQRGTEKPVSRSVVFH